MEFIKKNSTQIDTKLEKWKDNFIEINIYKKDNLFAYGYKIKIQKTIRQKIPFQKDFTLKTKQECFMSAKEEIKNLCSQSNKTKKILVEKFPLILYNQLELF